MNAKLFEQTKDRASLYSARCVVVAGDEHNWRAREGLAQALKLPEGKNDGVVRGPDAVKQVSRNNHDIGPGRYDAVNGSAEGARDIGFPLVDAVRSLPVVLPDTEMGVSDVGQFHGWRMDLNALKSTNLTLNLRRSHRPV